MPPRERPRRSLSNRGGAVELVGEPEAARALETALAATAGDTDQLTHGFHTYPARMHPGLARALVLALSQPGARVLDPFCGSGTVLVEIMLAGRKPIGVDLSPLAVRIAAVHCELRTKTERERLLRALEQVTEASLARVRARTKVRAPLTPAERTQYDPHVALELAGLLQELRQVQPEADRRALEVVFSSLLVKFSRRRADTSEDQAVKRIRKGLVSEFFLRKGRELLARWAELERVAPRDAVPPLLLCGDARQLPELLADEPRVELVVTSPPYGGTYDYHAHHALRYAWLGLDARAAERSEVGARRRLSGDAGPQGPRAAVSRWDQELSACLRAMHDVCKPGARLALVLGDAEVSGARVDASAQLARLAPGAGLQFVASAAQLRTDYRGGAARREHVVLLRRAATARA
jgi:DNA modification methylase